MNCTKLYNLTCAPSGFVLHETSPVALGEQRARFVIQSSLTMVQVISRLGYCWLLGARL